MRVLYSTKTIKNIMENYQFKFSKALGQNFLTDGNIVKKIVDVANVKNQNVIEVGPGIGTLSVEIAKRAKKLVLIEIDKSLIPILEENLKDFNNVTIISADVLKVDVEKLIEEQFDMNSCVFVSNLPYYITTPIIEKFASFNQYISQMTIMLQKEVAERMIASENDKNYSSLSLFTKFFSVPKRQFEVSKNVFFPKPKVDSTVLTLKLGFYDDSVCQKTLFRLIRAGFVKRRKTILNSLSSVISKDELKEILKKLELKENLRAENLSLDDFIAISNLFNDSKTV